MNEKVDILNREAFINFSLELIEMYYEDNQGVPFRYMVNGEVVKLLFWISYMKNLFLQRIMIST